MYDVVELEMWGPDVVKPPTIHKVFVTRHDRITRELGHRPWLLRVYVSLGEAVRSRSSVPVRKESVFRF